MLVFFTNLSLMEFQVRYLALFPLFSVIDGFRWFWMGSLYKNIQLMPQGCSLAPTLFLLYINNLPDDVIGNIAIYADDTTLYSRCDQASDLWQQLGLASELECDLRDTVDWGGKCLVDFNVGKTELVLFDQCKNVKCMGLFLRKNHLLRCWGWRSFLNWIGALTLSLLLKLPPRKLELWFYQLSFSWYCFVSL